MLARIDSVIILSFPISPVPRLTRLQHGARHGFRDAFRAFFFQPETNRSDCSLLELFGARPPRPA